MTRAVGSPKISYRGVEAFASRAATQRFARTIPRDIDAATHAIELPWSNGQTEGVAGREVLHFVIGFCSRIDLWPAEFVRGLQLLPEAGLGMMRAFRPTGNHRPPAGLLPLRLR